MSDWLSPLNRIRFQRAFKSKAPQVELDNGMNMKIIYLGNKVRVKPIPNDQWPSSFVPCGTWPLKTVTHVAWIEGA